MKILGLYNNECAKELFDWIEKESHEVVLVTQPLNDDWLASQRFDLAVSYTYRYIIKESSIRILNGNIVNLHISFLPFNRGADPNIWEVIDGTPRGVTLHYIDDKLDKGFIIAQKIVFDADTETLTSSYNHSDSAAKELFKECFHYYTYWPDMKKQVLGKGNYHSVKDGKGIKSMLQTYDISISEFRRKLEEYNSQKNVWADCPKTVSHMKPC